MFSFWFNTVISIIFLVCSINLFCGRGNWLILGYHASPPEEKARYDLKKFMRSCGWWCLYMAGTSIYLACQFLRYEWDMINLEDMRLEGLIYVALIMGGMIVGSRYLHKHCLKKENQDNN
ncbi:MAG: DUF3784 domain-containing protein [Eubacteriaceae bacterium]|jgi:hypothetical protein